MKKFWNNFYKKPLEEIPWQHTQADWFKELVDNDEFKGAAILDLGCGTGKKSVYLAKNNKCQKVIGVDIAKQAIQYAQQNAVESGVSDKCTFIIGDLEKWDFLQNEEKFDCILDWAAIHTISKDRLTEYAKNIEKHCKPKGLYLVRAFASKDHQPYFIEKVDSMELKVSFFEKNDFVKLFPEFEIIKTNTSQPKTKPDFYFIELLLQKK